MGSSGSTKGGYVWIAKGADNSSSTPMTLDASGNLGLGITPSAWSGMRAMDFGDGALSISSDGAGAGDGSLTWNGYYNGSNWIYKSSTSATRYRLSESSHFWYTAPSGTAGNAITFTQAMTLSSAGNLSVVGDINISDGQAYRSNNELILSRTNSTGEQRLGSGVVGDYIVLYAGASERARITAAGDFTVGDTTASAKIWSYRTDDGNTIGGRNTFATFSATVGFLGADRNTTNNSFFYLDCYNYGSGTYRLRIADSGNVTNTNGSYGTISDAKMKTDIVDAGSQWADIKAVRFRKFKMKDDPSGITQLGVVAQELEQTSPGLVDEHADRDAEGNDLGTTTKSVKSSILLMKAAVALQEAMTRIEELEAKVAALEAK